MTEQLRKTVLPILPLMIGLLAGCAEEPPAPVSEQNPFSATQSRPASKPVPVAKEPRSDEATADFGSPAPASSGAATSASATKQAPPNWGRKESGPEVTKDDAGASMPAESATSTTEDDAPEDVFKKRPKSSLKGTKPESKAVKEEVTEEDNGGMEARKSKKVAWTLDVFKLKIPDEPIAGIMYGDEFVIEQVKLEGSMLTFRQGSEFFADKSISISLALGPTESISGKTYRIRKTDSRVPLIRVGFKAEGAALPKTTTVTGKYAMILEFGKLDKNAGTIPGRIILCFPDGGKTMLAGNFEARL